MIKSKQTINVHPAVVAWRQSRDSGNNFRIPKIASVSGCFSLILFLFLHVVSSRINIEKWRHKPEECPEVTKTGGEKQYMEAALRGPVGN